MESSFSVSTSGFPDPDLIDHLPMRVFVAGSLIKGGPIFAPLPPKGAGPVIAVLFTMLFFGPTEEFGWPGVPQQPLQRHVAPIWAGGLSSDW